MKHRHSLPAARFRDRLRDQAARTACVMGVAALSACSSPKMPEGWEELGPRLGGHVGPAVQSGESGTARFAAPIFDIFESNAAMALTRALDAVHRAPASEGYDTSIDRINADLFGAGFGGDDGFELKVLSAPMQRPAWTPLSAEIIVVGTTGRGRETKIRMAGFDKPSDAARVMLPIGVPSFNVAGAAVFSMDDVVPGVILVTDQSVRSVEKDASDKGAVAVVSSFLLKYSVDPFSSKSKEPRHYDAIFAGTVRPGATLPSMYVSPRTAENMKQASLAGTTFELTGNARIEVNELRTVTATIRGTDRADEMVYVVAHADGAGANDNASGVGGIVEVARSLKRLIAAGTIQRPRRSIRFVFGQEAKAGETVLDEMDGTPIAGIVADMIGTSYAKTGAVCLMERGWDPAAVITLPPDVHTPWGAGAVAEEDIVPNGLSIVLRQAMVDVGEIATKRDETLWSTREHPWEGGSDHDAFLNRGIAAALVWHFTDFSYSTSLDRIDHVDSDELRRTSSAIGAAACAIADARPQDLGRYLETLNLERRIRLEAALVHEDGVALQEFWKDWFDGARFWLRALSGGDALPAEANLSSLDSYRR